MKFSKIIKMSLLVFVLNGTQSAFADGSVGGNSQTDQNCQYTEEQKAAQNHKQEQQKKYVLEMSAKLYQYLEQNQIDVAIVGRVGGNMTDRHFRLPEHHPAYAPSHKYSHVGFVHRDPKSGTFIFTHLLNLANCGETTNQSAIFDQSLAYFFMDDLYMFDIMVTVPSKDLQKKIMTVLNDTTVGKDGWARALHLNHYSNISNPFSLEYQNSNQWVLTVIAGAQAQVTERSAAQAYYKDHYFLASKADIAWYESSFGGMTQANFTTDDHTSYEKSMGWFNFVSAASVFNYLELSDRPLVNQKELCLGVGCNREVDQLP